MHILARGFSSIGVALLTLLALTGCTNDPPVADEAPRFLIGSDRDSHGCLSSAGYQWCAREKACVRSWELAGKKGFERTAQAFNAYCSDGRQSH